MLSHTLSKLLIFLLLVSAAANSLRAEDYLVFYLGGQSNMDGYGFVNQLPGDYQSGVPAVRIFHGNTSPDKKPVDGRGVWATLEPGHGVGFKSDGKQNNLSKRFGVELSFAKLISESLPGKKIAIIKYSRGGTSIDQRAAGGFGCWEPDFEQGDGNGKGVNQYDHFLATVRGAMASRDIDGDGEDDKLIPAGILWMQGESDAARSIEVADAYEANLKRLLDLIRAALHTDDLPVVIGRISDSGNDKKDGRVWDWGDRVRKAQADFVTKDGYAALVTTTDDYGYSDPWHYDTAGYLDLGKQFAEQMLGLINR
ncbi:MAG: sialate O-acetylesterase [Planctomycetota bacterium]|nr:sialate O-acetylesterase [Planctomycetota bacterium]